MIEVYLEAGAKRTFAGAIDWPGWCRGGRDEASALQALFEYGPRFARALRGAGLGFEAPAHPDDLTVTERLVGNATTDFGAPGVAPSADGRPVEEAELRRFLALLKGCWRAFDSAVERAAGKELRKGPRGGGRDLDAIVEHVVGADSAYLSRLVWKEPARELAGVRASILDALSSAVRNGLPQRGPRGGAIWRPRYFVRRVAWHVLDHAWETEDRSIAQPAASSSAASRRRSGSEA